MKPNRVSGKMNFYPRPPRGGRLCYTVYDYKNGEISIHALREEGDDGRQGAAYYH